MGGTCPRFIWIDLPKEMLQIINFNCGFTKKTKTHEKNENRRKGAKEKRAQYNPVQQTL